MGLSPQLITEALYKRAKSAMRGLSHQSRSGIRLQAIISSKTEGVAVVAKVFGVSTNTIRFWVKSFASEGLPGLKNRPGRGRKCKLDEKAIDAIQEWVKTNSSITISQIVEELDQKLHIKTSRSAVHRILQKIGLSYITARPIHYKQTQETQDEFKKKSAKRNQRKA